MTSRERIIAAINHQPVDRVPFDLFDEAGDCFIAGRYRPELRLGMDLPGQFQRRLDFQRRFGTDLIFDLPVPTTSAVPAQTTVLADGQPVAGIAASPSSSSMAWQPWPPNVAALFAGGAREVCTLTEWANGMRYLEVVDPDSGTRASHDPLVTSLEDLPKVIEMAQPDLAALDATYLDRARREAPDVALSATICGPFSMLLVGVGFAPGFCLLTDDPDGARRAIGAFAEAAAALAAEMVRRGANLIRIGEADSCLTSPMMFRQFAIEPLRVVCDAIAAAGGYACVHMCGRVAHVLDVLPDTHAPVLETLTPPPTGDVTLAEAKAAVGARMCLKGNLDPVHVVGPGSPELVAERTRECLQIGAPGGGFILSVADCLAPGTPEENLETIATVVRG